MGNFVTRKRKRARKMTNSIWGKQAAWLVATIIKLHESPSAHGLKWQKKMILHYNKQLTALIAVAPKDCKQRAREFAETVNEIIDCYDDVN